MHVRAPPSGAHRPLLRHAHRPQRPKIQPIFRAPDPVRPHHPRLRKLPIKHRIHVHQSTNRNLPLLHKQITVDGGMEVAHPALRTINHNVLANAPCSVGILVDRGLTGSSRLAVNQIGHHIPVLFIGGPDDREALAYAWRMSEHSGINLTVVRFLPGEEEDREKEMDVEIISQIRARASGDPSVIYKEKFVNNGQETVAAIRSMEAIYDLVIVGRGEGQTSPLTAGLTDWSECPEMGGIGDLLASKDFVSTCSVLVVQQYVGAEVIGEAGTPDSPSRQLHDRPFDLVRRTSP